MLQYLAQFGDQLPVLNILRYITFRATCAIFVAFFLGSLVSGIVDKFGRKHDKNLRDRQSIVFFVTLMCSVMLFVNLDSGYTWNAITVMLTCGFVIRTLDRLRGSGRLSTVLQRTVEASLLFSIGVVSALWKVTVAQAPLSMSIAAPFFRDWSLNVGGGYVLIGAGLVFLCAYMFRLAGELDGSIMWLIVVISPFVAVAYLEGNAVFSDYLEIHFVQGVGELTVLILAMIGAVLGLTWSNAIGTNTGLSHSLLVSLGGGFGSICIMLGQEVIVAILLLVLAIEPAAVATRRRGSGTFGRTMFSKTRGR